jgi:metal-sulfur cluster biosynthetic enzyme
MKTLEDFASDDPLEAKAPYPYEGPESLRQPILDALTRVVDPEVAMSIVDVGLIYGVTVNEEKVHVLLTMTSAACPVTDVIKEEVETELDRLAPPELLVHVELVWDPPWTMDRMSERARRFMGW